MGCSNKNTQIYFWIQGVKISCKAVIIVFLGFNGFKIPKNINTLIKIYTVTF